MQLIYSPFVALKLSRVQGAEELRPRLVNELNSEEQIIVAYDMYTREGMQGSCNEYSPRFVTANSPQTPSMC